MINTEIQAINIGTNTSSALYIGTNLIWSGSTPTPPPLPDNMEQQEFIPADIYEEHGDRIQPIDVTLGNIRVYSRDNNTYVDDYEFYVPNTDPTNLGYWLCVKTPSSWYVYSIEIEFDGGSEEFVGGTSSPYSFDNVGTYTISNGKLTWNWNAEDPARTVDFFNVADPEEYEELGLEITKITVVAAHKTVTSLNPPTISSVSNGDGTAQVTITSGNSGLNTRIFYDYPGPSSQHIYTGPFTLQEGASITDVYEAYNEYPFMSIYSESVSYTVPSAVQPGTYQFLPADDTPIANRQQYTVTRGGVSMTVSDGLIYLDQHYRIYAAQTITIDAGSGTITSIVLGFISGYANNGTTVLTPDSGECANCYDPDEFAVWYGSASSVVINTSKQIRLSYVSVTVE